MNVARRVATGFALAAVTIWALYWGGPLAFSVEVAFFIGLGLYEFFELMKKTGIPVSPFFGIAMGLVIPSVVYLQYGATQSGEVLFLVTGCFVLFVLKFFRAPDPRALEGVALTLFGILYVSWFLSFLIKIRFLEGGVLWVTYLIAVTKFADIGAFFVGSLLGRHPLIPHISPKKSVEGLVGGFAASAAVSAGFGPYLPVELSLAHLLVMGVLIAAVGLVGDLSESLMKRFANAKDSGGLLPGMGGVLDAADSVLFTAPIFYFHVLVLG